MLSINEKTVAADKSTAGVARQKLLADARNPINFSRVTVSAGSALNFSLPAKTVAWLQMLEGDATLSALYTDQMSSSHSVFLSPNYKAKLTTAKGATLLYAEIP